LILDILIEDVKSGSSQLQVAACFPYKHSIIRIMMLWAWMPCLLSITVVGGGKIPAYWPKYGGDRRVESLDGLWTTSRIASIDHPIPYDSMNQNLDPSSVQTEEIVRIPSCLDTAPLGYLGYRGVSFFRRHFKFDLSQGARILFQACSFYCRIWVNGQEIGEHRTGYVAFWMDIPAMPQEEDHELFVLVDNRFNRTTAPLHDGGDFWQYSGIMRSVEIHSLPPPTQEWPWRLYVFPKTLSSVELQLHLMSNTSGMMVVDNIFVGFDGGPRQSLSGVANNGIIDLGIHEVPKPRVWSTTDAQLHTLQVEMNCAIVSERFGLRIWDVKDARIRLNGEVIKLVGWNHHTQWPDTAASPTDQQLDSDIQLLLEGGANHVRGAHYPQDPRWLDRLDEHGFVMWCETGFPGMSVQDLTNPFWRHYQAQQMNEMLDHAMNHASVAFWAFFNEGPSDSEEACGAYRECADIIHTRDPTRFVTYASDKADDKCFAAADVVSRNGYPSWYIDRSPTEYWNEVANEVQSGNNPDTKGKPFLISETGAPGIYEWDKNESAVPWTLKFQAQVIEEDVDVALSNHNVSGISLWHFFDFKVDDKWENNTNCDYLPGVYPPICGYIKVNTSRSWDRPGGANHKGVLDFWRRKKPIFDIVAAKYNSTNQRISKSKIQVKN
jgi:beta-glucuronidase